ncbi:serine/threonine-protein kinase [Allocoleopsis franciscana]|uniref:WD40 repeat-containing protein n=1 Tax=Allocoleopsis franciscana PCC 7113 TaxID=1173027 RepID=K9WN08_9CYAN|nr:serine/threonine-protein kinase [Allocoleopsis franciscana]AFZ21800.1 WD40 repeat-containing protein [Allocoleopsis franciscana PCC 7113]
MLGKTLSGRYHIVQHLGGGGFGQTYLAEDLQLPSNPLCVVKQLKPKSTDSSTLQTAKRFFDREAEVLYKLGNHDQIPRLLAHFEQEQEFYLVQECIEGHDLKQELPRGKRLTEAQVIVLCQDILQILEFVHQQHVIHRDIKPANIIRRRQDGKLVLIDFGAVKEVTTGAINPSGNTSFSVAIGSPGYMPNEQLGGKPQFCSDIYAVGVLGIQALTGLSSSQLPQDLRTSEILWRDKWLHNMPPQQVQTSLELADVLDKMVRYDYRQRYQTVTEALQAFEQLTMVYCGSTTASISEVSFTESADPFEPTATYPRLPLVSDMPTDTMESKELTQALHSQQQPTSKTLGNLSDGQIADETITPLVSSRKKYRKLIAIGGGIVASVSLAFGIYHVYGYTMSLAESQWVQRISLSKTLPGDSNSFSPVAISPDGKTLASGSEDGTIKLWDLQTGKLRNTLKRPPSSDKRSKAVRAIAFSPDGKSLASGGEDNGIKVWNLDTKTLLHTLSEKSYWISALAISPDSQTLVGGNADGYITIGNLRTGELQNFFAGHSIIVNSLAISPDGQTAVSGSDDNTIKVWEIKTGQLIHTLTPPDSRRVFAVAISPDGKTIASGSEDGVVRLWNLGSGKLIQSLPVGSASINVVAYRVDGHTLVSGSRDGTIRLWDVRTRKVLRTMPGHSEPIYSLALSPDEQTLVSSSKDETIKIWRVP